MKRFAMAAVMLTVLAIPTMAAAATILDEGFNSLDGKVWRDFINSDDGKLEAKDGMLYITDVEGGWKQRGISLLNTIDLSAGLTTVEIDYKANGFTQQCPAFCTNGAPEGADIWNDPGFRITVGPETSDWEALSGFGGANGSIEKGGEAFDTVGPFTLKWTLKRKDGNLYDTAAYVNGEQKSTATIDMGDFDVKKAFFYFYVSNNSHEGPTIVDRIRITQD